MRVNDSRLGQDIAEDNAKTEPRLRRPCLRGGHRHKIW
jgi:hypothetical protein